MRISIFGLRRVGAGEMLQLFPCISLCHLTVLLAAASAPPSVKAMTLPDRAGSAACEPEAVQRHRCPANALLARLIRRLEATRPHRVNSPHADTH